MVGLCEGVFNIILEKQCVVKRRASPAVAPFGVKEKLLAEFDLGKPAPTAHPKIGAYCAKYFECSPF